MLIGGLRCHDADACAMGQQPCPTPKACGCEAETRHDALLLADQYAMHGWIAADPEWCKATEEVLRSQYARIAELEAELEAVGAGGVGEALRRP